MSDDDAPAIDAPVIDEWGRPEPPLAAGEAATLIGFLEFQRATFAHKCRVDSVGMRATVGASTMTLGGLVNHLSCVEDHWFGHMLQGHDWAEPWRSVDWAADPDWEWHVAASESPDEIHLRWTATVEVSRAMLDEAIAERGFDTMSRSPGSNGAPLSLRWILVHMIEEYARHNGHADLLREVVDGETGE